MLQLFINHERMDEVLKIPRDAKTGNIIDTVARFEVISVKVNGKNYINIIKIRLILFKPNSFHLSIKLATTCIATQMINHLKNKIISQGYITIFH